MKDFLKRVFASTGEGDSPARPRPESDVRVAACALFLEIANVDNEFSDEERKSILAILRNEFDLSEEHAVELARQAANELNESIDMWQFTNAINENYSDAEKTRVVELLWKIVYADGKLDAHEDYLIHRLGKLLRMQHRELIAAKLRVLQGDVD